MRKVLLENSFILIASICFYIFFWGEKMGLNILLFDLLIFTFLLILHPDIKGNRAVIITALGTLITASLVVWNNSLFSKVIHLVSFSAMIGLAKQKELRFLAYGLSLTFISFCEAPLKLIQKFTEPQTVQNFRFAPLWRSFRLSLLPLLVLLVFYGIYFISNPEFRSVSNSFWTHLITWFSWDISFPQIVFFISGVIICATLLLQSDFPLFKKIQATQQETLSRLKEKYPPFFKGMIALKNEFQSGLILLFSLNALLLIVNILDIKNYWLGTAYRLPPVEMKAMVHQSTYFLIVGLLLAMVVISYFFRKNLNFYPQNKKLKIAGYLWVAQNGILAISLFIKNYRYIEANDLAYKRIGVLIFLFLVFTGLITMMLKIKNQKTFYYLLHRNTWIAYAVFIICSFVNWDVLITNYNLSSQTSYEIDYAFLIGQVSDKNVSQLLEQERNNLLPEQKRKALSHAIKDKKDRFLKKQKSLSWLSWNYTDFKNLAYLNSLETKDKLMEY